MVLIYTQPHDLSLVIYEHVQGGRPLGHGINGFLFLSKTKTRFVVVILNTFTVSRTHFEYLSAPCKGVFTNVSFGHLVNVSLFYGFICMQRLPPDLYNQ